MPTARGLAVAGGGLLLWIGARLLGAPELHIVAVGLVLLAPFASAVMRWRYHDLRATRRLSARRVFPGSRVRVDLEIHNAGQTTTSVLLLEDSLPPQMGRGARAVLTGIPARNRQTMSYAVTCRARGRYRIGPLVAHVTDPFDLARRRIEFGRTHELIVYPEVEELGARHSGHAGSGSGESTARQLFRTGDEFYTMRSYEIGDDLRRIHWPSTARTGELMIRQDESARRATATIFLDTRVAAVGGDRRVFERAVSAAASVGSHYLQTGFGLVVATPDLPPRPVRREEFLEILAIAVPSRERSLAPSLRRLRAQPSGSNLAVITHLPLPEEIAALTRAASSYGARTAILLYPHDPEELPPQRRSEVRAWADGASAGLTRARWRVMLLSPEARLRDVWHGTTSTEQRRAAGS